MSIFNPSEATKPIEILQLGAPTRLTIGAPVTVEPDEPFFIRGILYATETGQLLSNQTISASYNGINLGSTTTGIEGDYLIQVSIPTEGTYTLKVSFAGSTILAASSANRTTRISALVEISPIAIALLLGVAYFILRK